MRSRLALLVLFLFCLSELTQLTRPAGAFAAAFTSTATVSQGSVSSGTIAPPTVLSAVGGCQNLILGPKITLTWTATTSGFAAGYQILRSSTNGGPYTLLTTVSDRTTVTYTDTTATGLNTTYYYVLRAQFLNWLSANSTQGSGTTPVLCL
jgi:hypothetical protein